MGTAVIGTIVLGIFVLVGYSTYKNGEKEVAAEEIVPIARAL